MTTTYLGQEPRTHADVWILWCDDGAAGFLAWLTALGRGLWRAPDPLRAALFAAALIQLWPIASSTGFTAMPVGGWSFLLLGWGLAEARWTETRQRETR